MDSGREGLGKREEAERGGLFKPHLAVKLEPHQWAGKSELTLLSYRPGRQGPQFIRHRMTRRADFFRDVARIAPFLVSVWCGHGSVGRLRIEPDTCGPEPGTDARGP